MPQPRRFDHDQAFEFWYGEVGQRRTMTATAEQFNVRADSMSKVARHESWNERAEHRDRQVRSEAERKIVKTHAQRVIDNLKMIDALKAIFARQLLSSGPSALSELTPREFIEIVKLEQLMTGQPTSVPGEQTRSRTLTEIDQELADMTDEDLLTDLKTVEGMRARLVGSD